jgi:hypothetical protein
MGIVHIKWIDYTDMLSLHRKLCIAATSTASCALPEGSGGGGGGAAIVIISSG